MKTRSRRKLVLTTESLRILSPGGLQMVQGGTQLISATDPITILPPPMTELTCTCPLRR
jgi:hypothetical protein